MNESFSIEFDGQALETHQIPATALAQSLLALDGLSKKAASVIYGSDVEVEIKVNAGFRPGSFIVDIVEEFIKTPVGATASLFTVLGGLVALCKWAYGKAVKVVEDDKESETVKVQNDIGSVSVFNRCVVNIYNNERAKSQLSRLTQTLDSDGVDSISLFKDEAGQREEFKINKEDRKYFSREEGVVLTDNESEVILYVLVGALNGSKFGWRFSEGEDGFEFNATVEDEDFLDGVKNRKITLVNGTTIRAVVRTVQRKNVRTITDRTVVEVKDVFDPAE